MTRATCLVCLLLIAPRSAHAQWRPSDLGAVNNAVNSWGEDVNETGAVVGTSLYGHPNLLRHAFYWTRETGLVDLGAPGGDIKRDYSWATGINNSHQVVGFYQVFDYGIDDWAFLWSPAAGMIELGGLGGWMARPYDINDAGQVVGEWYPNRGSIVSVPFIWTAAGGLMALPTFGGQNSRANAVNASGLVVGAVSSPGVAVAFRWTAQGGLVTLGTLGGANSHSTAVNDRGEIAGYSQVANGDVHAFFWSTQGGMIDLGTLGGTQSYAWGMNEAGDVVGESTTAEGSWRAFLWTPGDGMTELPTMGIQRESNVALRGHAMAINNSGQIAGSASSPSSERATLWDRRLDLALDFGPPYGLWTLEHGLRWRQVHNLTAEAFAVGNVDRGFADSHPDDLVVDFGQGVGVYAWLNHSSNWRYYLSTNSPTTLINADLDIDPFARDETILAFPGVGTLQVTFGFGSQLRTESADRMAVGELDGTPNDELLATFSGSGLWRHDCVPLPQQPGSPFPIHCEPLVGWTQIHPFDATLLLTADLDANPLDDVIVAFEGWGLWAFLNQTTWQLIHAFDPTHVAAGNLDGDNLADLVIDFGPGFGLWTLRNRTNWALLHGFASEGVLLLDRDGDGLDEVVVDFGPGIGLWESTNSTTWQMLHNLSPELMATGRFH